MITFAEFLVEAGTPPGHKLYHKDIGIPRALSAGPQVGLRMTFGTHAKDEARNEGLTKLSTILPTYTLIEVEAGPRGNATKWVVRFPSVEVKGSDVVVVLQPDGFVRTIWLNDVNDTHHTLDRSKYTVPTKFEL